MSLANLDINDLKRHGITTTYEVQASFDVVILGRGFPSLTGANYVNAFFRAELTEDLHAEYVEGGPG